MVSLQMEEGISDELIQFYLQALNKIAKTWENLQMTKACKPLLIDFSSSRCVLVCVHSIFPSRRKLSAKPSRAWCFNFCLRKKLINKNGQAMWQNGKEIEN